MKRHDWLAVYLIASGLCGLAVSLAIRDHPLASALTGALGVLVAWHSGRMYEVFWRQNEDR